MSQHTPGPWTVKPIGRGRYHLTTQSILGTAEGNARVMEQAPAMLAVLNCAAAGDCVYHGLTNHPCGGPEQGEPTCCACDARAILRAIAVPA